MQIAVTGAGGLIGRHLVKGLEQAGHGVYALKREGTGVGQQATWNVQTGKITTPGKFDVLVHLAGRNVAKRWSKKVKDEIWKSRVDATKAMCEEIAKMPAELRPNLIVAASAIGIYGNRGDEVLNETSTIAKEGASFLSDVCRGWEDATQPAENAGVPVIHVRIGVVLSREGGALAKMALPAKLCLAGPVGSGMQWMSWIWLEDLVRLLMRLSESENISGVVNAAAGSVRQHEFIRKLGGALRRPAVLPMPSFMVEFVFGQMGKEVLLGSQRVEAKRLPAGFAFKLANLRDAIRAELWR